MTGIARLWRDPDLRRFVTFLFVGGMNTAVGYVFYAIGLWFGLTPVIALAVAFALGVFWNFATYARLVFGSAGYGRLPIYVAVYVAIYAVNAGALKGLIALGVGPLLAQAIILPFAAVLTFLGVGKALTGRFPVGSGRLPGDPD